MEQMFAFPTPTPITSCYNSCNLLFTEALFCYCNLFIFALLFLPLKFKGRRENTEGYMRLLWLELGSHISGTWGCL